MDQSNKCRFFNTWPGLTVDLVMKHLDKSEATVKGHLRQTRQKFRSITKKLSITPSVPTTSSTISPLHVMTTSPINEGFRENMVSFKLVEIKGKVFSEQTGRFLITSSRGNKYIIVMYDNDSNAILAEPMKNRSQAEIVKTQAYLHEYLSKRGFTHQNPDVGQ